MKTQSMIMLGGTACIALIAFLVFTVISRILKRTAVGRQLTDAANKRLSAQPDKIHLVEDKSHSLVNQDRISAASDALKLLGFTDAGVFSITEMSGVFVKFLVSESESIAAGIFEHPRTGQWTEIFSHYPGDVFYSFTTAPDTGLDKREGTFMSHWPEMSVVAMYEQLKTERPQEGMLPMKAGDVVQRFENAYAVNTAWRKSKGISATEMSRHAGHFKAVAKKKKAENPPAPSPAS